MILILCFAFVIIKKRRHTILLPEISKSLIRKIQLDFENCEGIDLFQSEIVDFNINLNRELDVGSDNYQRCIKDGYLKIKFDKGYNCYRRNCLNQMLCFGERGSKQMETRLCGKKGYALHDICHLYIEYEYAGAGSYRRECLYVGDVRSEEENDAIAKWEKENGEDFYPCYVGGYAEKQKDDTILITFGYTSEKYDNFNRLLKECSAKNRENQQIKN